MTIVTIVAPALAVVTVEAAFAQLAVRQQEAREVLTRRLPEGFWLDDYAEDQWPEEADEYLFDLSLVLSRGLLSRHVAGLAKPSIPRIVAVRIRARWRPIDAPKTVIRQV